MREIAVIDLWTDSNRGDNALQLSLVGMLRRRYPGVGVTGVFRFGTNEFEAARPEIASTVAALDAAVGGVRRTYYAEANAGRFRGLAHQAVALVSFLEAFVCTLAFRVLGARSRMLVGADRHRSLSAVRHADLVVWKGKNFRDYAGLTATSRAMTLGGAGYFAGLLRPTIHSVNASFWPVRRLAPRLVYRRAFRRCRSITVRDPSSLVNARDLFGDRITLAVCPDLSFDLLADTDAFPGVEAAEGKEWDVALTVTAWGDDGAQRAYVDTLVAAALRLCDLGATRFVVVPQVTRAAEDNSALVAVLADRLLARVGVEVDTIVGEPSIAELLTTYSRCRMLIGSRMHSCVFARLVGVPFVALSYDSGPKWEVLSAFWPPELLLDYGSDAATVAKACEHVWEHGADLVAASAVPWQACVDGASDNVALLDG